MRIKKFAVLFTVLAVGFGCFAIVNSQQTPAPTYYSHVEQIIASSCLGCHVTGGIATFSLEKPETVKRLASGIKYSVENNLMPPWPPGPESPQMLHERKLRAEDKATLLAWIAAGAPLGDVSQRPATSPIQSQPLPTPDRTVAMNEGYTPNKALSDDYRCFLLNPQLKNDTYVTGYDIVPGARKLVHHIILFTIPEDSVPMAESMDRAQDGAGWQCFGGPGVNAAGLSGGLGFWVPGADATIFPAGTGRFLKAGSQIIMQVHYNTANMSNPVVDLTKLALYFDSGEIAILPLRDQVLAAPVEVRCPGEYPATDTSNPCNRTFAIQQTMMAQIANGIHSVCRTTVDQYQTRDIGDGSAQEMNCTYTIRANGLAIGVTSHMHVRGALTKIELNPDTPKATVLLQIPHWDFNWQGEYFFKEPIEIKSDDKLRISCTYDNSGPVPGPDKKPLEPRYLTWGEGTTDEMCLGRVSFIAK